MNEIYFKKDETEEDKTNAKHTYSVYLTNGKVFYVKATDYADNEDDNKFVDFYDGDWVTASIKADLIYAILDSAYADETYKIKYEEVK